MWEDATRISDAGDIRNATVYDCSVSRHHLQLEFAYHILVQGERGEPWSVRRSHAALRSLLRTQCDLSQLDEECAKDRALDPRRFLASRLRRRVALVNSLLARCISSEQFRAFVTEDDEDVPPEEPPAPPQRDVAWLAAAGP